MSSSPNDEGKGTTPRTREEALRQIKESQEGFTPKTRLNDFDAERIEDIKQDRALRKRYANWCIGIMIFQLLALNALMGGVGVGCLEYSDWLFHAFLIGTFGEIIGIVWVISAYLFPARKPPG